MSQPEKPKQPEASIYDIFSTNLGACEWTGEQDLVQNVNKSIFTPFAPKFLARKKYRATVNGEVVEAWVCQVGRNLQIWSV